MDRFEEENLAISKLKKAGNSVFVYHNPNTEEPVPGTFEILEDMNCCAPTDQILIAFNMDRSRKVMDAKEFLQFFEECTHEQ